MGIKDKKRKAWDYYKVWMKARTFSPALNKEIKVTRKGYDHTVNGRRKIKDMTVRLNLFPGARYVITISKSCKTSKIKNMKYHTLIGEFGTQNKKIKIQVVLREDSKGNVIFFSVMRCRNSKPSQA